MPMEIWEKCIFPLMSSNKDLGGYFRLLTFFSPPRRRFFVREITLKGLTLQGREFVRMMVGCYNAGG